MAKKYTRKFERVKQHKMEYYFHNVDKVRFIMVLPENAIKFTKTTIDKINYEIVTPQKIFNRDCTFIDDDEYIIGFDENQIFWKDELEIVVKDFPYKPLFKTNFNRINPIIDVYAGIGVCKKGYISWLPELTMYHIARNVLSGYIIVRCPNGSEPYVMFDKKYIYQNMKTLYNGSNFQVPPELTNLIHFSETLENAIEWQTAMRSHT
jgi:hypothetical protein